MRSGIKSRLEELEQRAGISDANNLTVILRHFVFAENGGLAKSILTGVEVKSGIGENMHWEFVARLDTETEDQFIDRIEARYRRTRSSILVLKERRMAA